MERINDFAQAFGVWDIAMPYISQMYSPAEMDLVACMAGEALTIEQIAARLGLSPEAAAEQVAAAFHRSMVNRQEDGRYTPATFYAQLDCFIKYEGWNDLPREVQLLLDQRYFNEFVAKHRENVERMRRGEEPDGSVPNDAVMLIHEIDEVLDAATTFALEPCDCRSAGKRCDKPAETCIALEGRAHDAIARGHGRQISREEAKAVVRMADKKGLMHTADLHWRENGPVGICNCCGCDCYPFRAGKELGTHGIWPKNRYVAERDQEKCTYCGLCVKRCHFAAFYHDKATVQIGGKTKANVRLEPAKCWGCGICATACPAQAITMRPLEESEPARHVE